MKIATGSIAVAGAALTSCDDDPPRAAGSEAEPFFSDDFTTDGHTWGDHWLNVRYESDWWVASGAGVCDVPPGVPKALAAGKARTEYMTQPVIYPGKVAATPTVTASVRRDGPIEAGLIACASFDESYALLAAEGRALLCRYGKTDREVLAERRIPPTATWMEFSLAVDGDGALRATVVVDGTRITLEARDPAPLGAGFVGTLVNPLGSTLGGKGKFKEFRARASEASEPMPRFTHRFTGGIVPDGSRYKARVTARAVVALPVAFELSVTSDFANAAEIAERVPEGRLGAVHAWFEGLEPATTYHWRPVAVADGARVPGPSASFRTPPRPGEATRFVFASCTSGRVSAYPSFATMETFEPELLIHSGDWGYADMCSTVRRGDHFQARWIRQLRAPEVASLLERTPLVFWQDDHDYAADNGWAETCQEYAVDAFDELHANPSDDYFDLRWGDVHIWCLDCRLHATDPEGPDDETKSRIGLEQKEWLKSGMAASDAPVKIVASAMVFRNKDPDDPGWHSVYSHERDELLQFFSEVEGTVAILSGDSHGHRLIHHFEFGELWEVNSSGTDFPAGGQDNYDPEHTPINISRGGGFALVELDPAGPDRRLTIRTIGSEDGATLFEKKLPVA
ncbi:MAG TPA: alkaline phosphatase D family protein [Actinomycetota bacterium]